MHPTAPPLRLTYLVTSSVIAGAELQVRDLAVEFTRRGWTVQAVSMLPIGPAFAELADERVETADLRMTRGIPDPRALANLTRLVRGWRPDVFHSHMVHANLLARLTRVMTRTPVLISTVHNQDEGAQWRYRAYRATDRLADLTTVVSEAARAEVVRRGAAPDDRVIVMPNGLDLARHEPDPIKRASTRKREGIEDRFVWVAAGRLAKAKDYPNMIAAFAIASERRPDALLLIAGEGDLDAELRASVAEAGLSERVRFLGLRRDLPDLMQAADGYLMSSAWEGLPLVLLEAAASGLPIVTTAVGGSDAVVLDGESGLIVPTHDPAALARAILTVVDLPADDRRRMGDLARQRVGSRFTLTAVADQWESIYRSLIARRLRRFDAERARELA